MQRSWPLSISVLAVGSPVLSQFDLDGGQRYVQAEPATWLLAGDWTGDHRPDVVISGARLRILANDGSGELLPAVVLPQHPGVGTSNRIVAGDFDGDGHLDLAVTYTGTSSARENRVGILLGTGSGGFTLGLLEDLAPHSAFGDTEALDLVAGDFDADGDRDLAVLSGVRSVARRRCELFVLRGGSEATFSVMGPFPLGDFTQGLATGDWNADGRADVVSMRWFGEDSELFFGATGVGLTPAGTIPFSAQDGEGVDVDGDGLDDLVLLQLTRVRFLRGRGDGTFEAGTPSPLDDPGRHLVVADLIGNGDLDLGIVGEEGATLCQGDGGGGFLDRGTLLSGSYPRAITATDLEGDGLGDLMTISASSYDLVVHSGHERASLGCKGVVRQPLGGSTGVGLVPIASDLDGDGFGDFLHFSAFDVQAFFGTHAGTFVPGPSSLIAYPGGRGSGDWNGDGHLDLAVGPWALAEVQVLAGDGMGGFAPFGLGALAAPARDIVGGDFDEDGQEDLVVVQSSGGLRVLVGDGRGGFTKVSGTPTHQLPGRLETGDWNGDDRLDVALAIPYLVDSYLYLGDGRGDWTVRHPLALEDAYMVHMLGGDFDEDGTLDMACLTSDGIEMRRGMRDGTFETVFSTEIFNADSLLAADVDQDGHLDLATAGRHGLVLLLGRGNGTFAERLYSCPRYGSRTLFWGDFGGRRRDDFLAIHHNGRFLDRVENLTRGPRASLAGSGFSGRTRSVRSSRASDALEATASPRPPRCPADPSGW